MRPIHSAFIRVILLTSMGAAITNADDLPVMLKGGFKSFTTPLPSSLAEAQQRKAEVRAKLRKLLGDLPATFTPRPAIDRSQPRDGYRLDHFTFDNGVGDTVYGYALVPLNRAGKVPGILYHHYHGGRYDNGKEEALNRKAFEKDGLDFAPAERLAQMGYVVVVIDAYCFGERRWQGPAGKKEEGRQTEWALAKTFAWQGRTLWGMIVRDDLLALDYLCSRDDVDAQRIAAMGMSMGSTRTWWLSALDDRIRATVSVSCLTRYQNLIAHGALNQHGFYYFVPGMLHEGLDTESVIACIAPRAHLTMTGDSDDGSPVDGARIINDYQAKLYALYGKPENFRGVIYDNTGHVWNRAMWDETVKWIKRHIGP